MTIKELVEQYANSRYWVEYKETYKWQQDYVQVHPYGYRLFKEQEEIAYLEMDFDNPQNIGKIMVLPNTTIADIYTLQDITGWKFDIKEGMRQDG